MRKILMASVMVLVVCLSGCAGGKQPATRQTQPAVTGPIDLSRGLIARYPLDGDADDAGGRARHGRLFHAEPIADKNGRPGKALAFHPRHNAHLGMMTDNGFPAGDAPRSVSVWLRTASAGTGGFALVDYGMMQFNCNNSLCLINTRIKMAFWDNDLWGTTPVSDGLWHHVVAVWDGRLVSLYLDGRLDAFRELQRKPDTVLSGSFTIGITNNRQWHAYEGALDDVRIYDRALSAPEVSALFSEGP